MPELKADPTLIDFQQYVIKLKQERGFSSQTATDKCLLPGEEIGELFKAVRRTNGLAIDPASTKFELEDELADVFIYLCAIANRYNISLEQAFRNKEKKNKQRNWVKQT